MSDMLETLAILAFFGAAGLVLGVIAGLRLDRRARMAGMLLGLAAGIALSIEIRREVVGQRLVHRGDRPPLRAVPAGLQRRFRLRCRLGRAQPEASTKGHAADW